MYNYDTRHEANLLLYVFLDFNWANMVLSKKQIIINRRFCFSLWLDLIFMQIADDGDDQKQKIKKAKMMM